MTTDYHNHSLPGIDSGAQTVGQANSMLAKLRELGFNRVFLTPHFQPGKEISVRGFIRRRSAAFAEICKVIPRGLIAVAGAETELSQGITYTENFRLLTLGKTQHILVSLPLKCEYPDWMDAEFNRLLYKLKLRPVFAGFERYRYFYAEEQYEKLMNIPGAAYQFNLNSLTEKQTISVVLRLMKSKKPIIFGTNAKNDLNRMPDTSPLIYLRKAVSLLDYNYFILKSNNFIKKFR